MQKVFSIAVADMKFKLGEFGKPHLANHENAHFNISHSGSIVVCAVYDKPVGIDVQRMNAVHFAAIAQRVFTVNERDIFFITLQESKKKQFYKTWTAKESYIKFLGTGVRDLSKEIDIACNIDSTCVFDDYMLSVCYKP